MKRLFSILICFAIAVTAFAQVGLSPGIVASGGADITPPAFVSAELGTFNDTIILVLMTEPLDSDSIPPTSAFTFTGGVTTIGLDTTWMGSVGSDSLFIGLDSTLTIFDDSTFLIDYTPPVGVAGVNGKLQDVADNTVVAWVDSTVANNLVLSLGAEKITDGAFDNDGASWVSQGAPITFSSNRVNISNASADGFYQLAATMVSQLESSTDYLLEITVTINSGANPEIEIQNYPTNAILVALTTYAAGTHQIEFTTPVLSYYGIRFLVDNGNGTTDCYFDDISLKEVL